MTVAAPRELAEQTAEALRAGTPGLAEFRSRFEACSDLFEQGLDREARQALDDLLPALLDFAGFCAAILDHSLRHLPDDCTAPLAALNLRLEQAFAAAVEHSAAGDVLCTADSLRLDLSPLMAGYESQFAQLALRWDSLSAS